MLAICFYVRHATALYYIDMLLLNVLRRLVGKLFDAVDLQDQVQGTAEVKAHHAADPIPSPLFPHEHMFLTTNRLIHISVPASAFTYLRRNVTACNP